MEVSETVEFCSKRLQCRALGSLCARATADTAETWCFLDLIPLVILTCDYSSLEEVLVFDPTCSFVCLSSSAHGE